MNLSVDRKIVQHISLFGAEVIPKVLVSCLVICHVVWSFVMMFGEHSITNTVCSLSLQAFLQLLCLKNFFLKMLSNLAVLLKIKQILI